MVWVLEEKIESVTSLRKSCCVRENASSPGERVKAQRSNELQKVPCRGHQSVHFIAALVALHHSGSGTGIISQRKAGLISHGERIQEQQAKENQVMAL